MVQNAEITVSLTPKFRLEQALKGAGISDPKVVSKLTVLGKIREKDFIFICKNMGKTLQELDMSKTSIQNNKIDSGTFSNCSCLTSIAVNPTNPVYASKNGVLFNKNKTKLIIYPRGRQGDYIIPDSVKKIVWWAFDSCEYLTTLTIPASVIDIEYWAIHNCPCLTSIIVHPDNPAYVSENGLLLNKDKTELIAYTAGLQSNCILPDTVVSTYQNYVPY